MIEVDLRAATPGCVRYPLGCMTLGLVPLLTRNAEGRFIRRMDDAGVETRRGKRIAWSAFTKATRMSSTMGGAAACPTNCCYSRPRGKCPSRSGARATPRRR